MTKLKNVTLYLAISMLISCTSKDSYNHKKQNLADQNGQIFTLNDYEGKWVILNFWATWCKPCRSELPELSKFHALHKDNDAVVVGINMDGLNQEKLAQVSRDLSIDFPITASNIASNLGISLEYIPTTVFIKPNGIIAKIEVKQQTLHSLEESIV